MNFINKVMSETLLVMGAKSPLMGDPPEIFPVKQLPFLEYLFPDFRVTSPFH